MIKDKTVTMSNIPLTEDIKTCININARIQLKIASSLASEEDRKILQPLLCLEACFKHMALDGYTRCTAEPTPPPGVEGGSVVHR